MMTLKLPKCFSYISASDVQSTIRLVFNHVSTNY